MVRLQGSTVSGTGEGVNQGEEERASGTTSTIKTTTALAEGEGGEPSRPQQVSKDQGETQEDETEDSRRPDQSLFRSDGRPTWYDDIGVPLFKR